MKSNSSNLEQFIRQHRAAFDMAEPGAYNWPAIEKALNRLPAAGGLEQELLLQRPLLDTASPSKNVWANIERALDAPPARAATDGLEAYIQEHRDAFDTETPDLRVWAVIEQNMPASEAKTIHVHWQRNLLRAAAALALLVTGLSIGLWYGQKGAAQPGMAMSDVSTEYAELEQYYQRDITAKKEKLATLASYRDEDLADDLQQMDQVMSELRQDLADVPPGNREQVVRAMIENYKAKAAILERVLEHLEQQQPATTNSGNHEVQKI